LADQSLRRRPYRLADVNQQRRIGAKNGNGRRPGADGRPLESNWILQLLLEFGAAGI
jgi:hypothetical protein